MFNGIDGLNYFSIALFKTANNIKIQNTKGLQNIHINMTTAFNNKYMTGENATTLKIQLKFTKHFVF